MKISVACFSIPLLWMSTATASAPEGRHSFSLTTFDPNGQLGQVTRAIQAAEAGPPLIARRTKDGRLEMAAASVLPSPLIVDDGTRRFVAVDSTIVVGHTGLSADGRYLLAEAQRLALEYRYTWDEPMPIGDFLQELSMLLQQSTMQAATRPLGSMLVVGHASGWYRLDPSGTVTRYADQLVVGGNGMTVPINDDDDRSLSEVLRLAVQEQARKRGRDKAVSWSIVTASLTPDGQFTMGLV